MLKNILANIPIRTKLLLFTFITCFIVLITCFAAILIIDINEYKENKVKGLQSMAQIIGSSSISALEFLDNKAANETLSDLKVETDVINATILDKTGNQFATYTRKGKPPYRFSFSKASKNSFEFMGDNLFVYSKIMHGNDVLGYVCLNAELVQYKSMIRMKVEIALLVLSLGLGLAFIIASILQKYISVPILNLKNLMQKVKSTENYKNRAIVEGKDEVGTLSQAYNDMLDTIEKREEQLEKAKIIAEQSNAAKDVFLSSMSHEIRTPMNAIIGFQQLLKETSLNQEQNEFVESIDFACRNLLVIINDILDLSKIEAGRLEFSESVFNISKIVQGVIELVEPNAKNKNLTIYYHQDPRIPKLLIGDSARLSQILLNLVGNAIKFTERGYIKISVKLLSESPAHSLCEFDVEDTGIGIPPEKINNVFERFTQVSADTTRKYGGTGLGLTISRHLVEMQGGKIGVTSKLGQGSVFTFQLQFKKTEEHLRPSVVILEKSHKTFEEPERKLKILLAEDIELNQNLVVRIFNKTPHQLDIASNGKIAIEKITKNDYDIILMDIQMPEMDGTQATKFIRNMEDPVKRNVPIIALTAYASQNEVEQFMNVGMNGFVTKPFNKQHLLDTLYSVLYQSKNNMQQFEQKDTEPSLYSLSFIEETGDGDKEFIAQMIKIFLKDTQERIDDLFNALKNKQYELAGKVAHKIKNLAIPFKITKGIELSQTIEQEAYTHKSIDIMEENALELKKIMQRAMELIQKDLSNYLN